MVSPNGQNKLAGALVSLAGSKETNACEKMVTFPYNQLDKEGFLQALPFAIYPLKSWENGDLGMEGKSVHGNSPDMS